MPSLLPNLSGQPLNGARIVSRGAFVYQQTEVCLLFLLTSFSLHPDYYTTNKTPAETVCANSRPPAFGVGVADQIGSPRFIICRLSIYSCHESFGVLAFPGIKMSDVASTTVVETREKALLWLPFLALLVVYLPALYDRVIEW